MTGSGEWFRTPKLPKCSRTIRAKRLRHYIMCLFFRPKAADKNPAGPVGSGRYLGRRLSHDVLEFFVFRELNGQRCPWISRRQNGRRVQSSTLCSSGSPERDAFGIQVAALLETLSRRHTPIAAPSSSAGAESHRRREQLPSIHHGLKVVRHAQFVLNTI